MFCKMQQLFLGPKLPPIHSATTRELIGSVEYPAYRGDTPLLQKSGTENGGNGR
jgi:hypothetical protein